MKRRFRLFSSRPRIIAVGFRPTIGGLWFILGTSLIGLAALDADVNLLVAIFGFCAGAVLINAFYGWRTLPLISIRRVVPDTAVAGQPFVIRYIVTNRGRIGVARNLHIEDVLPRRGVSIRPEVFVPSIGPGVTATVTAIVTPAARGRLSLTAMRVSTRFPFHLFVKSMRHESKQEVVIFPPLARMLKDTTIGAPAAETSGGSVTLGWQRGDEEFYGVREFREGDNPRRIHWRRSAGRGRLMVREMARPRSFQLWCVVNTQIRPHDADQTRRLDAAISAAATVICDALERGARVGLICGGEPFVVLPPGSGRAYRPRMLTELAIRTLNTNIELAGQIYKQPWPSHWNAPCLLFGANQDEDMRAATRALNRALGATTVYVPGTPLFDASFDWPDHPAFTELLASRGASAPMERRSLGVQRTTMAQALRGMRG